MGVAMFGYDEMGHWVKSAELWGGEENKKPD